MKCGESRESEMWLCCAELRTEHLTQCIHHASSMLRCSHRSTHTTSSERVQAIVCRKGCINCDCVSTDKASSYFDINMHARDGLMHTTSMLMMLSLENLAQIQNKQLNMDVTRSFHCPEISIVSSRPSGAACARKLRSKGRKLLTTLRPDSSRTPCRKANSIRKGGPV